ncbi:hypothetical protein G9A89_011050 [Geosiphon pyriformis]|nr:hypothetical protein G9A89_011050 [Geosiphon pyriformis]
MRITTEEDVNQMYKETLRGGIFGGAKAFLVIGFCSVIAQWAWPYYRGLTLPIKTYGVVAATTAGTVISAERRMLDYERRKHKKEAYLARRRRQEIFSAGTTGSAES